MDPLLVRGRAEARLPASYGVLDVTVHVRHPESQDAAVRRTAELCALVDATVTTYAESAEPLVRTARTSSIRISDTWEYDQSGRRRRIGWTATRSTELECAPDGDGLTGLVDDLVSDGIRIRGPRWHVTAAAPGWDAARSAAVADARRRAEAYADGAGHQIGGIRWIAEPGLRLPSAGVPEVESFPVSARSAAFAMENAAEETEPLQVRIAVEPVVVEVIVEAAFDLA